MRSASLLAVAFILLTRGASAMTCADSLTQAQKLYAAGNFQETVSYLRLECSPKLSRTMAIQAQALLVQALIYDERTDEARKEVSKLLRLEPGFDPGSPGRFAALVEQVRREELTTQVVSVSKTSESLREAPATVVVVTGDEIERRGYLDLEQLLHDLPGFDVSRTNGDIYSKIFQRGYYNEFNDRLLLLVDGVEQNDLTQGTAYLSRQYPLTNIDRVEVIYGPASTMYGANAYTGVISIVTKEPAAIVGQNKRFGIISHVTAGGYGNQAVDVTAAGTESGGTVAWSIAGHFQEGSERDLSRFDTWDYTYSNLAYGFNIVPIIGDARDCTLLSKYIQCTPAGIRLTPEGVNFARQADRDLIEKNGLGFDDRAKNWGLNAKVQVANLTLGLQSWRSKEGIASAYGARRFGGNTSFTPEQTAAYLKYSLRLAAVTLKVFTRYMQSSIDRESSQFDYLATLSNGWLLRECQGRLCTPNEGFVLQFANGALSTQLRNEISLAWQPLEKLSGVLGVEFVKSTIQAQYHQFVNGEDDHLFANRAEYNYHTDTALWAQGSWKPRPSLRFILAGRASHNSVDNNPDFFGFGVLFTPRLGVIYTPAGRRLVLKAIYSEAFKDPPDVEKIGVYLFPRILSATTGNADLRPEQVRNMEMSAGWEPSERVALQVSAYEARYSGVVALEAVTDARECQDVLFFPCVQNRNRDSVRVRGVEAQGRYEWSPAAEIWANYTHTQPVRSRPLPGDPKDTEVVRVANIASNQLNVGLEVDWRRLTAAVRTHYSGRRKIGRGTSFTTFPDYLGTEVAPVSTTAVSLSYRDVVPNVTAQVIVDNLFDKQHFVVGSETLPRVLQAGRTVNLRLI